MHKTSCVLNLREVVDVLRQRDAELHSKDADATQQVFDVPFVADAVAESIDDQTEYQVAEVRIQVADTCQPQSR